MATRLFFPETEAAPVSPTIDGTDWGHINTLRRKLLKTPDASTLTSTAYTPDGADHGVDMNAHHRQYVSDPMPAQAITGTVKAQFQGLEAHANNNQFLTLKVYVVSNDGLTVRGTLLAITRDATEWTTGLLNRQFGSTAVTNVTAEANDRLVVEVGMGGTPGGGGGVQGHNGTLRWGCSASSGDLPENDTEAGTTFRAWIEFSQDLFAQVLSADPLAYAETLAAATVLATRVLTASPVAHTLSLAAATLAHGFALDAGPLAYSVILAGTTLQASRALGADPLTYTGGINAATLLHGAVLSAGPLSYALGVADATLLLGGAGASLVADPLAYTLGIAEATLEVGGGVAPAGPTPSGATRDWRVLRLAQQYRDDQDLLAILEVLDP